ncbi:MAG: DNA/RNA non-specific endonuclease [Leuconostoc lactis]|uniref:DNA/RNA non-specific endonuclease n=1 Tax=Leuconostoc lactis TaxID=1246 RepID=UPI0039937FE7
MKNYRMWKVARFWLIGLLIVIGFCYFNRVQIIQKIIEVTSQANIVSIEKQTDTSSQNEQLGKLDYKGQNVISVNNNKPSFSSRDLQVKNNGWQKLSSLDWLGRPQIANALLNQKLMPPPQTKKARERLTVRTPGYHAIRTGQNPSDWLYNRSHLIGYQFTGLNNESKNLFTGTRQLNADSRKDTQSMVTFESEVAEYLKSSPDHYVRYQVEPIYRNVELVPRGIHMQAQSLTDNVVSFNIYIFNVQDGWQINYLNGQASRIND